MGSDGARDSLNKKIRLQTPRLDLFHASTRVGQGAGCKGHGVLERIGQALYGEIVHTYTVVAPVLSTVVL